MSKINYQQCVRCVMDNQNDPDIVFDQSGICNHCHSFDKAMAELPVGFEKEKELNRIINEIKAAGKNKAYDCLLGISGGVDSSYLAYICKKYELRPLIVHFDNGWNSELAVKNIENLVSKLGLQYQTIVIDWEEFKDIQLAYFKAGVVDLELPNDHAIMATMFDLAYQYKIKHIISGHNVVTEGVKLPVSWRFNKLDFRNIKDIHQRFGKVKLKTYPHLSFWKRVYYNRFLKQEFVQLLNYVDYNKQAAKNLLMEQLGWRDYGGKHYESVFTRFYQAYILPQKFNIDKRYYHYACLVQSGQMSREEALSELKLPVYPHDLLMEDKAYVCKKLEFSEQSFEAYMQAPPHHHKEYKTDELWWKRYYQVLRFLSKIKRIIFFYKNR
jgi:N-acetyl sugar amidotransferase